MPPKTRDFGLLKDQLSQAGAVPQPQVPASTPPAPAPVKRGRPTKATEPMQLRVSAALKKALIADAARQSVEAGQHVTPNQVALAVLLAHYGITEEETSTHG